MSVPLIRAFIAFDIGEGLRGALAGVQEGLKETRADVRWVGIEGIHLTLKFLGNVPEDRVEDIAGGMARASTGVPPSRVRLAGLGAFPSPKSPRVVWVGVREESGSLRSLHGRLETEMEALGFPRESREFQPHLTLGRVRSPSGRDALLRALASRTDSEIGAFTADTLILFKSTLLPSGAEYSRLRSVSLE